MVFWAESENLGPAFRRQTFRGFFFSGGRDDQGGGNFLVAGGIAGIRGYP